MQKVKGSSASPIIRRIISGDESRPKLMSNEQRSVAIIQLSPSQIIYKQKKKGNS